MVWFEHIVVTVTWSGINQVLKDAILQRDGKPIKEGNEAAEDARTPTRSQKGTKWEY